MGDGHVLTDYESVKPSRWPVPRAEGDAPASHAASEADGPAAADWAADSESKPGGARAKAGGGRGEKSGETSRAVLAEVWSRRRGHFVSYCGLLLFTAFIYFRPYELFSLPAIREGAQYIAILTLVAFFPAQFVAEGNLTALPREVVLVLLLALAALLSIPLAISPGEAWEHFLEFGKVILMFVVMVNAVRTERRLRLMILLSLAASVVMSLAALNDYRAGNLLIGGTRLKGVIGGLFENPNDLALHLLTMVPLAACLMLARRGPLRKLVYGLTVTLLVAAVVVTFSRGGFLGLTAASAVLAWKLARKNRALVVVLAVVVMAVFIAAAPGEYGDRLSSIFGGDATGSASARQGLFWRSVLVALRYPIFGVGLGNFHFKSLQEQVSHNSYTQVAAEMGVAALVVYCLFIITPIRRLRHVERLTLDVKAKARFYYLSVGLQASLVGYMVSSSFASVAHLWYVYYLVGYAVCLRRLYVLEEGHAGTPDAAAARALAGGPATDAARADLRTAGSAT